MLLRRLITPIQLISITLFSFSASVWAVPMPGTFQPGTLCDGPNLTSFELTHELGDGPAANPFPIDERIAVTVTPSQDPRLFECVADDGVSNDFIVNIQNTSTWIWEDLYLVTDEFGGILGQYDGSMTNPAFPTDPDTPAFRIDGTITPGVHNPLFAESLVDDEIFDLGEVWTFGITNFSGGTPTFASIGFGPSGFSDPNSNVSILANPVPEPTGANLAVAFLLCAWIVGRRRQPLIREIVSQ